MRHASGRLARGIGIALVVGVALATAKPADAKKKRIVALFPFISRDSPDPATVEAASNLLSKGSGMVEGVLVVTGLPLKKRLRKDPATLIDACGTNLVCIAALGKRVKADEVMLVRATPEGSQVKASFIVVSVKTKGIARKMSLTFASAEAVKTTLGGAFFEVFGVTEPGILLVTGAVGEVTVDGKPVGNGPGPHKVPPGLHEVVANGRTQSVMVQPKKKKVITADDGEGGDGVAVAAATPAPDPAEDLPLEPVLEAPKGPDKGHHETTAVASTATPPASTEEPAATTDRTTSESTETLTANEADTELALAPPPPRATPPLEEEGGPGVLTWAGVGAGAVGLGLMIGAAPLYFPASSTLSRLEDERLSGNPTTSQIDALDQSNRAMADYNVAMGLFFAGAGLAVAGAVLATLDLVVLQPTTSVSVGAGVGRVDVAFTW